MNTPRMLPIVAIAALASFPAMGIVINVGSPSSLDRTYDAQTSAPPSFGGVNLSGVVKVLVGSTQCSGSLLADGFSILTAGHCIGNSATELFGTSATVTFMGPTGFVSQTASSLSTDPGWDGNVHDGNDLAVLHLDVAAPVFAARYSIFAGVPDINNAVDIVAGYGYAGTGSAGYDSVNYGYGTLRAGSNQYVVRGGNIGGPDSWLVAQNYNPDASPFNTNILGSQHPYSSSSAAGIAPGDSGGPTFQNGFLVGVHDVIGCFTFVASTACNPTGHPVDSSFGEYFADTNVAQGSNFAWIMQQQQSATVVPEPSAFSLVLAAGCLLALRWRLS